MIWEHVSKFEGVLFISCLDKFPHVWRLVGARLRLVLVQELWPLREVEHHVEGGHKPVGQVLAQEGPVHVEVVRVVRTNRLQYLR